MFEVSSSVVRYITAKDISTFEKAVREMERKVRGLTREAGRREETLARFMESLTEISKLISGYISDIHGIGVALGPEREGRGSVAPDLAFTLDLACAEIGLIEKRCAALVGVLDGLSGHLSEFCGKVRDKADDLDKRLEDVLEATQQSRDVLIDRMERSLPSLQEFTSGWSELTGWFAHAHEIWLYEKGVVREASAPCSVTRPQAPLRKDFCERDGGSSLSSAHEDIGREAASLSSRAPLAEEGLSVVACSLKELCSRMMVETRGRTAAGRHRPRRVKRSFRSLASSVESYLMLDEKILKGMKRSSEVFASVFRSIMEVGNSALKIKLIAMNLSMHLSGTRDAQADGKVLPGSFKRYPAACGGDTRLSSPLGERTQVRGEELNRSLIPRSLLRGIPFYDLATVTDELIARVSGAISEIMPHIDSEAASAPVERESMKFTREIMRLPDMAAELQILLGSLAVQGLSLISDINAFIACIDKEEQAGEALLNTFMVKSPGTKEESHS